MVIDSSALIAIMVGEPERASFSQAIIAGQTRLTSAATLLETSIVILGRRGELGLAALQTFIDQLRIETVPFTAEQSVVAIEAFRRFGKGRHPARLNLGDCFSYALAKATDQPLLFKGEDFARTDIRRAI